MFAKLVGEGYDLPEAGSDLPLDINYAKVNEWLVDRRLLPQDWNRKLQLVQAKAADASKELPPGFLSQFNGGDDAPLDYFLSKQVLSKLTETAERGLLGSLKGEAGAWERVVKAYEANLFNAAEGGLTLARNVDYEIPYLKKQAAKNQQLMSDLDRRAADALKSAAAAAAEFAAELEGMGIDPGAAAAGAAGLRTALLGLTAELPALVGAATAAARADAVTDAVAYYTAFCAMSGAEAGAAQLATLAEVRDGRTPLPADLTLPAARKAGGAAEGGDAGGISWDLDGGDADGDGDADADGISWDFDVVVPETDAGPAADDPSAVMGISWGIDISATGEDSQATGGADSDSHSAAAPAAPRTGASLAAAGTLDASTPPEVARLVVDPGYRALLLDDLYELRAFLGQRAAELAGDNASLLASAPAAVAAVDRAAAGAMRAAADTAIAAITAGRCQSLLALATSPAHLDREAAKLARAAGQEAKFRGAAAEAGARKGETQRQLVADSAKLAALLRRTRDVKAGVEAAVAGKLGRRVNIQGEINAVLAV